ncbi:unnamed protein product [Amoebophrya sp. A25]|nr:unnamed protein product [Amoebophrya sp. A25]|eukprot:GSA25T00003180001.1
MKHVASFQLPSRQSFFSLLAQCFLKTPFAFPFQLPFTCAGPFGFPPAFCWFLPPPFCCCAPPPFFVLLPLPLVAAAAACCCCHFFLRKQLSSV